MHLSTQQDLTLYSFMYLYYSFLTYKGVHRVKFRIKVQGDPKLNSLNLKLHLEVIKTLNFSVDLGLVKL